MGVVSLSVVLLIACGGDGGGGSPDAGSATDAGARDGGRADAGPPPDAGMVDAGGLDAGPACTSDMECDDGVHCNGAETCEGSVCAPGVPIECDDGDPCTVDACSEAERTCVHPAGDVDMDGHAAAGCGGDDCDDADATRFPGNPETCDAEDEDCDASTLGATDADLDGHVSSACCNGAACGDDCDDSSSGVHPGATETCNEVDDDCDGMTDEMVQRTFYRDADGDDFGDPTAPAMMACTLPTGYAELGTDCDDGDPARNPGAPEVCDTIDNDCDGAVDDGVSGSFWRDADGDLYGDPTMMVTCPTAGYVTNGDDCYDANRDAHPGQAMYFPTHRGDGSYDYDCDTLQSPRDTMQGSCRGPCNASLCPTYLIRGWMSLPAPACGDSAPYYVSCLGVGCGGTLTLCRGGTMEETQHCR